MQEICAVIAAGGLGTRLKDYRDNKSTKVNILTQTIFVLYYLIFIIFHRT